MITETQLIRVPSLTLDGGETLKDIQVAYEMYGQLNAAKSNAILVMHAFTGDAHAAGIDHDGKPGWWANMIGPGKAFDTDLYCVICANILGGCRGTTGPSSINPETDKPYGKKFPFITISDMIRLQKCLLDSLGIVKLLAVAGGSMGGMLALQWSVTFPESVEAAIPIASAARHSAQQIAFNETGRQAILGDPNFHGGDYYDKTPPARGLAVARMVGHITYMSDESMREKFGRRTRDSQQLGIGFDLNFEVENYLRYRGNQFVGRFDANSYLYITKAMDSFDLSAGFPSLASSLERAKCKFLVISFTSDWLYPSYQSLEVVSALRSRNHDVTYCQLSSSYGHDAFLVDVGEQTEVVRSFLARIAREVGLA